MVRQLLDYPCMERQDLTQGQLQAFKFSLVDDLGPTNRQHLSAPLSRSVQRCTKRPQPLYNLNKTTNVSAIDGSYDYLNNHKPSLDEGNFKGDSATTQPYANSASSSPKRHFIQASAQRCLQVNGHSMAINGMHPLHESLSSHHGGTFQAIKDDLSYDSNHSLDNSLLEALKNEQFAHHQTRLALETEQGRRIEAEAETKRLVDHNKSLLNSIRLLQSTVKHMVRKDQAEAAADEIVQNSKKAPIAGVNGSILYDTLKQQRRQVEQHQQTGSNTESLASAFNLELLIKPRDSDNSEKAQLQRALRKELGLSADQPAEHVYSLDTKEGVQPGPLTSLSMAEHQALQQHPWQSSLEFHPQQHKNSNLFSQQPSNIGQPMLQLPSSFLGKYRKPSPAPVPSPSSSVGSDEAEDPKHGNNSSVRQHVWPRKSDTMPGTIQINWTLKQDELTDFLNAPRHTYPASKESWYFKHPLRYLPRITEKNVFRTVMIDFLPQGSTYSDVLAQVRGGVLESVQMYGPVTGATNFVSARIVFIHEASAAQLHERGQNPGIFVKSQRARVWQVSEPTYPRNQELEDLIYEEGYTRLLIIDAPYSRMEQLLKQKLKHQIGGGFVLDISSTADNMTLAEFTAIAEAERALRLLIADPDLEEIQFDFDRDYCADKYFSS